MYKIFKVIWCVNAMLTKEILNLIFNNFISKNPKIRRIYFELPTRYVNVFI